ncbi:MAG TPA: hypothetical protein VM935_03595 [Chitinophagaceae bacterium]|nr:hypothetical protein [Chitinophagaceae bacterium]
MKLLTCLFLSLTLLACKNETKPVASDPSSRLPLVGTWKLLTGTLIEKGDTTVTDYTKNISFEKIINETHFAFLQHDLNKGKDSAAVFVAGGGRYTLKDSAYTEHLEYCSARNWEGNDFSFTVSLNNDTLIQKGIEKIESEGINRVNIERYTRVKNQ